MHLTVSVVDPATGRACDVEVQAPQGASFGRLRPSLLAAVGRAGGVLCLDDRALPDGATLGEPPLLDGAVLTVGATQRPRPPGLLELHVEAGPDAGQVVHLSPGEHTVGRAVGAAVRLDDPDVSRLHAVLHVGAAGTTVRDLRSTNGTLVEGQHADADRGRPLRPGQELRVGSSRLRLVEPEVVAVSCRPDGAGHLLLNRPPRHAPVTEPVRVTFPAPPPGRERPRFPLLATVAPLALGLVLALVTRTPAYALFVLLSPVLMLGTHLSERSAAGRASRAAEREHARAVARCEETVAQALAQQAAARHHCHPGAATLLATVSGPRPRLWERGRDDLDFLALRLGVGDVAADVELRRRLGTDGDPTAESRPRLRDVPVTVALPGCGVLGLAGPRSRVLALARWLVGQVAGWHSPRHVRLVVLAPHDPAEWEWTRWLPHTEPRDGEGATRLVAVDAEQLRARVGELVALLESRQQQAQRGLARAWTGPATVVLMDGAEALRRVPGVARLLGEGPAVGIYSLCLERALVSLPAECGATAEVRGETAAGLRIVDGGGPAADDVVVDGVAAAWAHRLARALAPVRDATPDDTAGLLPDRARLLDLLPVDATDPAALAQRWRAQPRDTTAVLGVGADGRPFAVDLAADGPHVLVAGTTGAGKSELLRTLVVGLAAVNSPESLGFVLVDYKGGAAFQGCARLPHTAGLVTDLDGHLTQRALESLGAELRRRERLLRAAGCADITDYLASAAAAREPLARLVIVVDEFATLAEELPGFLAGLVGIAQRGRSLGVHLVLATQRPAGVVSADIRANTGLRIALRVTDPAESVDVVDVRDAADLPRRLPGRAVVRTGTGLVRPLQTAQVSEPANPRPDADRPVLARPLPWAKVGAPPPPSAAPGATGPSDLDVVAAAMARAAAQLGPHRSTQPPWLPPLPALLALSSLGAVSEAETASGLALAVGRRDDPAGQRQPVFHLSLGHGTHLLGVGGPRSGRTTLLRTVAAALATRLSPDEAHLYVLDGGGGLAALAELPHCGAVVGPAEPARAARLLERLAALVDERLHLLAAAGLGSVEEQHTAVPATDRLPWVVLLVDGWEGFAQALEEYDGGRAVETLTRLAWAGSAAGLRIVLTGGRPLLTGRLGSHLGQRLMLRMADPADYALAGIPPAKVPAAMPPGRALLAPDGVEVQLAITGGRPDVADQTRALLALAAAAQPPTRHRPIRVAALPVRVELAELLPSQPRAAADATGPRVLLGVGGDEAAPVVVDLEEDGPAFVVAGPPGSGRSTALLAMARSLLHEGRPVALVAHRRSPLRGLGTEPGVLACLDPAEGTGAARSASVLGTVLATQPSTVVLVDDVESVADQPVEPVLLHLLRPDRTGGGLVLSGTTADFAASYRGIAAEARRGRTGLLLGPVAAGEDALGVRLPRAPAGPPGRAVLVRRGRTTPVQVAWSPAPPVALTTHAGQRVTMAR